METRSQWMHDLAERLGSRLQAYFPEDWLDHPGVWVSHLFENVRKAIRAGDRVAVSIACELIDQDPMLPFGKLIKSGLSRELRKNVDCLTVDERAQVIRATARLLALPYAPRELEDYVRLLAKFPREEYLAQIVVIEVQNNKAAELRGRLLAF